MLFFHFMRIIKNKIENLSFNNIFNLSVTRILLLFFLYSNKMKSTLIIIGFERNKIQQENIGFFIFHFLCKHEPLECKLSSSGNNVHVNFFSSLFFFHKEWINIVIKKSFVLNFSTSCNSFLNRYLH